MGGWLGDNRRKHPRFERGDRFRCFYAGQKFMVKAVNQGPGGAYLEIPKVIKPGTILVLEDPASESVGTKNHLVAKVLYFSVKPVAGVGVQWLKAVAPEGVDRLAAFLNRVLQLELSSADTDKLGGAARELPVTYDFATGRIAVEKALAAKKEEKFVSLFGIKVREGALAKVDSMGVQLVQSEAPRQKRVIMGEDQGLASRDTSREDPLEVAKQMRDRLRILQTKKEIKEEVALIVEGVKVPARVIGVDSKALFVESDQVLPPEGKRVLLHFTIKMKTLTHPIVIVGEVTWRIRNRSSGREEADVKIITVNEGDRVGIFRQYVHQL